MVLLGRIYENIWADKLEKTASAFVPGAKWATYVIKLNDEGNLYEIWGKLDAEDGYTYVGAIEANGNHADGKFTLSCGYGGGDSEAYISDFEVWQAPKNAVTATEAEILGSYYVADAIDLTDMDNLDATIANQGVTAAKDGIVTYDATNGVTVVTTADNYAAQVYGDWEWANGKWSPFSDSYKAIRMVAKAEKGGEIQIRAGP